MKTLLGYQNRRRFTTKTKYYQYWVQNDLFDLVLVKTWGSLTCKRGNQQSIPIQFSDLPIFSPIVKRYVFQGQGQFSILMSGLVISLHKIAFKNLAKTLPNNRESFKMPYLKKGITL